MKDTTVKTWKKWMLRQFEASRVVQTTEDSIEAKFRYAQINVVFSFRHDLMEKFNEHVGFGNNLYYIYEETRNYIDEERRSGKYKYVVDIGNYLVEVQMVHWSYNGYTFDFLSKEYPHRLQSRAVELTLSEEETRRKKEVFEAVKSFEKRFGKQRLRRLFG